MSSTQDAHRGSIESKEVEKMDDSHSDISSPTQEPIRIQSRASSRPRFERSRSRRNSLPFGLQAGLGEENFDRESELEMQRTKSRRNEQQGILDDPNLVEWDGPEDPANPMNWPVWKKWTITFALAFMSLVCTFASSVFSVAIRQTAELFHVSNEVMILGVSLFVLGFAVGPIVWGPMSELYGRKLPLFIGYTIFAIFQIPVAVAQNPETVLVCRFLGGCFACAPLVIVGSSLADFWGPVDRGVAMAVFAATLIIGPGLSPIMGGFITQSHLGWRWTAWITLIMAALFGIIGFVLIPESYGPVILQQRANRLRYETKNWALHAKADEREVNLTEIATKYLTRPFAMLIMEPILLALTVYMSILYGIIYAFFEVFPIVFQEQRGWSEGVGGLAFIPLMIGVVLACGLIVYLTKTRFARKLKEQGKIVPEERLLPAILGGFLLPIGLFWFGWSNHLASPWSQLIAIVPIGMGFMLIFLQSLTYIIDCYLMLAASAIAANTFARSLVGAGFPMFSTQMFHTLGVPWACSLLAFLLIAIIPAPVLFYKYGEKLRKMSKFSPY